MGLQAERTVEDLEKALAETKYEKIQLEKAMGEFALQNQQLMNERSENTRFLEDARAALARFRKREEEYPFSTFYLSSFLPFASPFSSFPFFTFFLLFPLTCESTKVLEASMNKSISKNKNESKSEIVEETKEDSVLGDLELRLENRLINEKPVAVKKPQTGGAENNEDFFVLVRFLLPSPSPLPSSHKHFIHLVNRQPQQLKSHWLLKGNQAAILWTFTNCIKKQFRRKYHSTSGMTG